MTKIVNLLQPL